MKLQMTFLTVAALMTASVFAGNCATKKCATETKSECASKAKSECATKCDDAKEDCDIACEKDCETECDKAEVTHYNVTGMTCTSCSKKLNSALSAVEGVTVKKICHKSGCVDVVLGEGATAKQVEDVITKAGYKIVPAEQS